MINVVLCFDSKLKEYALVTLASLLKNKKDDTHYNIMAIVSDDLIEENLFFEEYVKDRDSLSKFEMRICNLNVSDAYEIRNISKATYYRFAIPQLFNVDKAIYLDVDVLVKADLSELWDIDMKNNYVHGVRADVNIFSSWSHKRTRFDYWTKFDDWRGNYINAGVLLLNLNMIRKNSVIERCIELIDYPFFYQDQDIINLVMKPFIGFLPPKFNCMTFYTDKGLLKLEKQRIFTSDEIEESVNRPAIIHYAGKKPWDDNNTRRGDEWWDFVLNDKYLEKVLKNKYEMINAIRLSIIVPVFNGEKYLRECLDSILPQMKDSYELICVNDGSCDESLLILNENVERCKNFKIINIEHSGLSVARNEGIKHARGEYIFFVDADDIIVKGILDKYYGICKENDLDLLLFSFEDFCDIKDINDKYEKMIKKDKIRKNYLEVENGVSLMRKLVEEGEYYCVVWAQFVKRKILVDNFIIFYRGIVFEDVLYTYRLMWACKKVLCINDVGYKKRLHKESICGGKVTTDMARSAWKNLKKIIMLNEEFDIASEDEEVVALAGVKGCLKQFVRNYCALTSIEQKEFLSCLSYHDRINCKLLIELHD